MQWPEIAKVAINIEFYFILFYLFFHNEMWYFRVSDDKGHLKASEVKKGQVGSGDFDSNVSVLNCSV